MATLVGRPGLLLQRLLLVLAQGPNFFIKGFFVFSSEPSCNTLVDELVFARLAHSLVTSGVDLTPKARASHSYFRYRKYKTSV